MNNPQNVLAPNIQLYIIYNYPRNVCRKLLKKLEFDQTTWFPNYQKIKKKKKEKPPDSSKDLEVEDDEGDDGDGAREHEAGPVDIVSDIVDMIYDIWYMIYDIWYLI